RLRQGLGHEALIVCGGVSVGERDLVKGELRRLGVELNLWRVSIKPGKPFLFGTASGCAVFGLPGNPVSAFVTFVRFVRPALLKMMGATDLELPVSRVVLADAIENAEERPHYFRGRVTRGVFKLSGRQESHALFGLSRSNALVRVAPGERFAAGEI